jgi:hypothetical protein
LSTARSGIETVVGIDIEADSDDLLVALGNRLSNQLLFLGSSRRTAAVRALRGLGELDSARSS